MRSTPTLARLAAAVLPVVAAAVAGGLVTRPAIPTWYAGLAKPAFTPPNWVFGPAWTLLYALMALAAWRILRLPEDTPGRARALALYYAQLALNAAWSFAFFGARSPALGLVVIAALLALILATIRAFHPLDRPAAWLMAPYLAWVGYASALNGAIWGMN